MFNSGKMFQVLLISMFFIQLPNFAEAKTASKSKVSAANIKLKYDPKVYYKLSHKNRLKYLQIFSDLAVQMEKADKNRKTAEFDFYQNLQDILFPRADAQATTVCLNGGIFFDKPAGAATCSAVTDIPESHRFSNLTPYYNCGIAKRCAAYFGVDSSGQGFCFDNASSATSQCDARSTAANGRQNLRDKLNNCSGNASFCEAFNAAMTADQAKIDQYCNSSRNSASYCQTARTAIAALPGAATPAAAPATSMLDAGSGCSEANMQAITGNDFNTLQRQLNFDRSADSYWMYMATMAQHACGSYRDIQQVLRVVGVCQAPSSQVGTCTGEVERLGTCIRDSFNQGTVEDFKKRIAEIDNTLCKLAPGSTTSYVCIEGRSPFQIRNDIAAGNLTGLERVVTRMCPSQGTAFNSCRAANPVRSTTVVNPENIRQHLNQNNRIMATQAIDALVAGTAPSSSQQGGFYDSFGITTSEFKDLFCATDAAAFRAAQTAAFRARPSSGNAMRERMRNCMETAVVNGTADNGVPVVRSNYSARSCTMQEITGVIPSQAQGYLYYEKSTGLCRKASEIVSGSAVPTGQVIVPCRGSDIVTSTVRASQQYVRLDHAVTGGSDVQPVYACLDNIITGGADKLDIYRSSCSTADSSGDGADSSVAH